MKTYIEEAHLSGFKTIKDVEIKFNDELNIIIGKNSSGKTNFLSFLYSQLEIENSNNINFSSYLKLKNDSEFEIISKDSIRENKDLNILSIAKGKLIKTIVNKDGAEIISSKSEIFDNESFHHLNNNGLYYDTIFIKHGIPNDYLFLNKPYEFSSSLDYLSEGIINNIQNNNYPFFVKTLLIKILLQVFMLEQKEVIEVKEIKNSLSKYITSVLEPLESKLSDYNPIKGVRLSSNFNVYIDEEKQVLNVSNLFLELKVENTWHPFDNLSDGTKRLFYIVSEIGVAEPSEVKSNICLVEEPELGVHPHQFMLIMNFLKEEAKQQQIIMSSHSPLALNILNSDELDKIIIAFYTKNKGTLLRHLTADEIDKAKLYLEDEFLGDYWVYSDLEEDE